MSAAPLTRRHLLRLALLAAGGAVAFPQRGGAQTSPRPPEREGQPWQAPHRLDHPWLGRLWSPRERRFLPLAEALERCVSARYVLLGENHGHPDHHALQAWVLSRLIDQGRRPAVVWEMINTQQAPALAAWQSDPTATAATLGEAVAWGETGWPAWPLYQPIAEAAHAAALPMRVGNLPNDQIRTLSREGLDSLDPTLRARLGLDSPIPPLLMEEHGLAVVDGHCGLIPLEATPPLAQVQAVRDALMAESLAAGAAQSPTTNAVLIAGSGHIRCDVGVPWWLARHHGAEEGQTLALAFRVVPGEEDGQGPDPSADQPFDLVWYTPADTLEDPCDAYRDQLERFRSR